MRIPAVERILAMLGYVPLLWWLPIVGKRDSMFCQFHGRQAGVLLGLALLPIVIIFVVMFFLPSQGGEASLQSKASPWLFGAIAAIGIVYLLMSLVGFVKAGIRERYRMPVVADVALLLRL